MVNFPKSKAATKVRLTRPTYSREPVLTKSTSNIPLPLPSIEGGKEGGESGNPPGSSKFQQALNLALQLTVDERKQLLDQLALRNQMTASAAGDRDLEMWSQAVYDALQDALGGGLGAGVGPLILKRALAATQSWRPVQEFMVSSKLADLTVMKRQSIYGKLAQLLVANAKRIADYRQAPLSTKMVANCTVNIAGIFNAQFPGYLKAGLAPLVADQLASGFMNKS